jgi:hypothetical protein
MKAYSKPTIEFIELKPEERLACVSNSPSGGSCSGGGPAYFWFWCGHSFPWGPWCMPKKYYNSWCR